MSDTQPAPAQPRKRNWLKILLILSVSLNLLIAGAVISRFVVAKRMIYAQGMGAPGLMLRESRHMMRMVSRERREELHQVMVPHRQVLRRSSGEIGDTRTRIANLLTTETLDKAALSKALKELNAAEDKAHQSITKLREDFLMALTADERRRFAEGMLKRRHRGGGGPPWERRRNMGPMR